MPRHRGPIAAAPLCLLSGGAALLALAGWGLRHDVYWIAQPFYAWAWWGYILLLDGFCAARRGSSLLTTRRRIFLPMCVWSTSFWFTFELLNARFQNWYYVGVVPPTTWGTALAGGVFTVASFSTVFVGLFETDDALAAAGLWRSPGGRRRRLPRALAPGLQAIGVVMVLAAVLWPRYLAPLVWGSVTFLIDPLNYRLGRRSFLRDIERGHPGRVIRLLVAGAICGVVWESLNFFAPQKWIYTVRGLEGLKLFEMPLLGFLGFPALALDATAVFSMLAPRRTAASVEVTARFRASLPLQVLFWIAVSAVIFRTSIGSVRVVLEDLGLQPGEVRALAAAGVESPRQLLRAAADPDSRQALLEASEWPSVRLEALAARAELYTFKGIGAANGGLLERSGVRAVGDLETWSVEALHTRLRDAASAEGRPAPLLDRVRVWVLASRDRGILLDAEDRP